MAKAFSETLKQLRTEKKISQQKLADLLFVDRSTVASWETGRRVPDAMMLSRIAVCLDTNVNMLLGTAAKETRETHVMVVDDERIILTGSMEAVKATMPDAAVSGFYRPSDAISFARGTRVALAFLDIEMRPISGFELCRRLLLINPSMNVVFLTAYADYSFPAWDTGACGFLLKPLTPEKIRKQLAHLRFPIVESEP